MIYIILGCAGFLTIHLFDVAALKKWPALKPATWFLGSSTLVYAISCLFLYGKRFPLPLWLSWTGGALFVFSLAMLVLSLFVNLPFRKTYVEAGVGDRLITNGLYALVRHPGVHWFSLSLVGLVLITRSIQMLVALPVFIALDVILVIVQDRWVFTRMFRDYANYQRVTPMLIPNRRSIKAFINSVSSGFETR
jgi:protein-S-isoprenylcysteine O-methyltransferase Ste14